MGSELVAVACFIFPLTYANHPSAIPALSWRYFCSSSQFGPCSYKPFETLTIPPPPNEYDDIQSYSESFSTVSFLRCCGRLQGSKQIWNKGLASPVFTFHRSEVRDIIGSQLVQSSQLRCDSNTSCKGVDQEKERSNYLWLVLQREKELEGLETLRSIAELPSPTETSLSIITPPKVNSASMMKSCI